MLPNHRFSVQQKLTTLKGKRASFSLGEAKSHTPSQTLKGASLKEWETFKEKHPLGSRANVNTVTRQLVADVSTGRVQHELQDFCLDNVTLVRLVNKSSTT